MNKIVLGIVIMAVLLGGLGAGFVAGCKYKCMEEEQVFNRAFMEINEEWGCSCYYTGDMQRGFECLGDCVDDVFGRREDQYDERLREMGEDLDECHEAFDEVFRQGVYEGYCQCAGIAKSGRVEFDPQTDGVCYAFRQEYVFPCTDQLTNFWVSYVDDNMVHSRRVEYCQPCDYVVGN